MHDLEIVRHGDQRRRSQRPALIGDCGKEFCREEGRGLAFVGGERKGIPVGFSKYLDVLARGWDGESEFPNRASHFPC